MNIIIVVIVIRSMVDEYFDSHVHGYPCQIQYVNRITMDNPGHLYGLVDEFFAAQMLGWTQQKINKID